MWAPTAPNWIEEPAFMLNDSSMKSDDGPHLHVSPSQHDREKNFFLHPMRNSRTLSMIREMTRAKKIELNTRTHLFISMWDSDSKDLVQAQKKKTIRRMLAYQARLDFKLERCASISDVKTIPSRILSDASH